MLVVNKILAMNIAESQTNQLKIILSLNKKKLLISISQKIYNLT